MNKQTIEVDVDAIVGLACATAMFSSGFDNTCSFDEVRESVDDDFDDLLKSATDYCKWAGVDVEITIGDFVQSVFANDDEADEFAENY